MCVQHAGRGSLSKRLLTCELECARASEHPLASERPPEERQRTIERLLADKRELIKERNHLRNELRGVGKLPSLVSETDATAARSREMEDRQQSSDDHSGASEYNSEGTNHDGENQNPVQRLPARRIPRLAQPPGFNIR